MIHYARNEEGKNIVEIETFPDDLMPSVYTVNYSLELLDLSFKKRLQFIAHVGDIEECRAIYFEDPTDKRSPTEIGKDLIKQFCVTWGYHYVED